MGSQYFSVTIPSPPCKFFGVEHNVTSKMHELQVNEAKIFAFSSPEMAVVSKPLHCPPQVASAQ